MMKLSKSTYVLSLCFALNFAIADDKSNSDGSTRVEETDNPQTIQITEMQLVSISFDSLEIFQKSLDAILSEALPPNVYQPIASDLDLRVTEKMPIGESEEITGTEIEMPAVTETSINLYESYLADSKEPDFDLVSFKREMLLSIGHVYDLDISFSANANDPSIADSTTNSRSTELSGETEHPVGALAGVGMLIYALEDDEETFLDESSSFSYDSSVATTFTGYQEYKNVAQYFSTSSIHPYTLIGVDYAYGMGLSGDGKIIAIQDSEFMTSGIHIEVVDKAAAGNLSIEGTLVSGGGWHGTHVAGIAAADFNDNNDDFSSSSGAYDWSASAYPLLDYGMMGVAYGAGLHLSDYNRSSGGSLVAGTALNFDAAYTAGAIVINNSWGMGTCQSGDCTYTIDRFTDYQTTNGTSDTATLEAMDNLPVTDADDWQTLIDAMTTYQSTGVIVFASGNDETNGEPNVYAGLPVLVTELADAWLTVGNLDVTGSTVTSSAITRYSNECGLAAEFCVYADGQDISSSIGYASSANLNYQVYDGSSMAAPQISGAIALLSQAFPNHTPAQLVDRILASANNDFFTATGTTSFVNGVSHGYNAEFGHGIVNLEAALQPISSSSMIPANGGSSSIYRASRFSLGTSSVDLGYSFGDSLSNALHGQTAYFYDGLNGGFAFNAGNLINKPKWTSAILVAPAALETVGDESLQFTLTAHSDHKLPVDPSLAVTRKISDQSAISIGEKINPQIWVLGLSETGSGKKIEQASEFMIPFVQASVNGRYAGAETQLAGQRIALTSFSGTSQVNAVPSHGILIATTLEIGDSKFAAFAGTTLETSGLLDSSINGAFAESSETVTQFTGLAARGNLSSKWGFESMASIGFSRLNVEGSGMLQDIDEVTSSTWAFEASRGLDPSTSFHIGVSQPLRVESGKGQIELPLLYGSDGLINSHIVEADLSPSGRQIDFKTGVRRNLGQAGELTAIGLLSKDAGHVSQSGLTPSALLKWSMPF
jgi:subtilase-type serine protease